MSYSARSTKFMSYSTRITKNFKGIAWEEGYSAKSTKKWCYSARSTIKLNYLSIKPLVFSNTLSQMWDRLKLPMLLFKEGLLTLM